MVCTAGRHSHCSLIPLEQDTEVLLTLKPVNHIDEDLVREIPKQENSLNVTGAMRKKLTNSVLTSFRQSQ